MFPLTYSLSNHWLEKWLKLGYFKQLKQNEHLEIIKWLRKKATISMNTFFKLYSQVLYGKQIAKTKSIMKNKVLCKSGKELRKNDYK